MVRIVLKTNKIEGIQLEDSKIKFPKNRSHHNCWNLEQLVLRWGDSRLIPISAATFNVVPPSCSIIQVVDSVCS